MKVKILPENIRTSVPVFIEVSEVNSAPKIEVSEIGKIAVQKHHKQANTFISDFYVQIPGEYKIKIVHQSEVYSKTLTITQQEFLTFDKEFGVFSILLSLVMLGVIIWTRKIMKRSKA